MEPGASVGVELRRYLKRILLKTAALHVGAGMVSFVALSAWVFLALIVWTRLTSEPSLALATFVGRCAVVVVIALFGYFVVWPLIRMPRLETLAAEVENRKDLDELLRAGFEFSNDDAVSRRYSPALVKEVIRQAVERITGLQVRFLFLSRKDLAMLPVAYGGLLLLFLISIISPVSLIDAARRVTAPSEVAASEHRANIQASPGDVTVLAGTDVTVAGLDLGQTKDEVTIRFNLAKDFWKTEPTRKVEPVAGTPGEAAFNRYEYVFEDLRHTLSYSFQSGAYKGDVHTITVVHKPILNDLRIALTPPKYTGEPEVVLDDNGGNVQALEGTRVSVTGVSNNPLANAWVRFDGEPAQPVVSDSHTVSFGFTALEDGHYSVLLEDTLGFKTEDPLVYTVEVFEDYPPSLEVIDPGGDTVLPRNQRISVGFVASDDYGVRSAALYHRRVGASDFVRLDVPLGDQLGGRDVAAAHDWNLAALSLFPGNYVEYYVEVTDNNVVTGPGVTRSRTFRISVPTMAQIYDHVDDEQARRTDVLDKTIQESRDFRERLEKITREFIKTQKMEWAQKKEIDKALEKQESVEDHLEDVKQSFDKTLQEMSDNEMTSEQIGEKLEEIRDLLDEIDSKELQQYMEDLQKAAEKLSPEDIRKALQKINVSADEMLEKLERTASLLKEIQKEQQMEELVRKSQDLMNRQKELGDETALADENDKDTMDKLSDRQEELARKADELKDSVEEMAKDANDSSLSEQLGDMSQQLDRQQGPQRDMRKASNELGKQQRKSAMGEQQQAMNKLIHLFQSAQNAQSQMQMGQMRRMAANYEKFAKRTLELSFKQEALAQSLGEGAVVDESNADAGLEGAVRNQMSYLRATEKVADGVMKMAGESLSVPPAVMTAIGQAVEQMQNSVLFLEQDKSFMSTAHANNAVKSLNDATIEMLRGAKQCSAGSPQGGGNPSVQQMLQQMIPRQQDVLQQTQSMMEMQALSEKLRQERQAQLDRLSGQQRSLKEIAEQIQRSMKDEPNSLGRLDRTIEDMEAVIQSLESDDLDETLINREQRILSRLLDAQRSVHTRDYEQKRESVTAEDVFSRSLGAQKPEPATRKLREEIRRAMQLKAPGEFEDLIKLYFRALAVESLAAPEGEGN